MHPAPAALPPPARHLCIALARRSAARITGATGAVRLLLRESPAATSHRAGSATDRSAAPYTHTSVGGFWTTTGTPVHLVLSSRPLPTYCIRACTERIA